MAHFKHLKCIQAVIVTLSFALSLSLLSCAEREDGPLVIAIDETAYTAYRLPIPIGLLTIKILQKGGAITQ